MKLRAKKTRPYKAAQQAASNTRMPYNQSKNKNNSNTKSLQIDKIKKLREKNNNNKHNRRFSQFAHFKHVKYAFEFEFEFEFEPSTCSSSVLHNHKSTRLKYPLNTLAYKMVAIFVIYR